MMARLDIWLRHRNGLSHCYEHIFYTKKIVHRYTNGLAHLGLATDVCEYTTFTLGVLTKWRHIPMGLH